MFFFPLFLVPFLFFFLFLFFRVSLPPLSLLLFLLSFVFVLRSGCMAAGGRAGVGVEGRGVHGRDGAASFFLGRQSSPAAAAHCFSLLVCAFCCDATDSVLLLSSFLHSSSIHSSSFAPRVSFVFSVRVRCNTRGQSECIQRRSLMLFCAVLRVCTGRGI